MFWVNFALVVAVVDLHPKETWANSPTLLQHAHGDRNWEVSLNNGVNNIVKAVFVVVFSSPTDRLSMLT